MMTSLLPLLLSCAAHDLGDAPVEADFALSTGVDLVLFITVDTLRADYLGAYGHPTVKTPELDQLAREGVLFEQCIAPAPTTLPSHVSLLTGTHPHTHGVPRNGWQVPEENLFLTEMLDAKGWKTAGFTTSSNLVPRLGFAQGFDDYTKVVTPGHEKDDNPLGDGRTLTDAVLGYVDGHREGPLFLFVHYWDVHWPYTPEPPYDTMYGKTKVKGTMEELEALRKDLANDVDGARSRSNDMKKLYAGEVSFTDAQIGRLLDGLRDRGLLDRSLVVLTSDHGESMDEHHDYWDHGPTVYNAVTHVPLILRLPGGQRGGTRVAQPVSGVDVAPTLMELLGLQTPARVEGTSLVPAIEGGPLSRGAVYSEASYPGGNFPAGPVWENSRKCRGIWTDDWKYVHCPEWKRQELYASTDWSEASNLATREASRSAELEALLSAWDAEAKPYGAERDATDETADMLRALGYVE